MGNPNNYIVFSGKIENPTPDSLSIFRSSNDILETTIHLKKDTTFRDTLNLSEGFYILQYGKKKTPVYLKPKQDLSVQLKAQQFPKSIIFKGVGANENSYLSEKKRLEENIGEVAYYTEYSKLSEEDFLKFNDSLYQLKTNLLEENQNSLDKGFLFIESKTLESEKLNRIVTFERYKKAYDNREYKVSDNYPNPFYDIDLVNDKLHLSDEYMRLIYYYLQRKVNSRLGTSKNKNSDSTFFRILKNEVISEKIIEKLAYNHGKMWLTQTNKLDSVYNVLDTLITDNKYLSKLREIHEKYKKMENGQPSPNFELNDVDGNIVSLKDLRGKLVYIDLWGTYCKPCFALMPALKKIEEHFKGKDIHFVGIGMDPTDELWKKRIEQFNMGGLQLRAPSRDIPFLKDYDLAGIPRFILIDKNGNIIDADARRPDDPKLIDELETLL